MGKLFFSKIDKIDWKKFQKFSIFKKIYYIFFFHMFDLQLSQLPLLYPAHAFKESCSQNFIFLGERKSERFSSADL